MDLNCEKTLLTINEVSLLTGVKSRTIHSWIHRGKLNATKILIDGHHKCLVDINDVNNIISYSNCEIHERSEIETYIENNKRKSKEYSKTHREKRSEYEKIYRKNNKERVKMREKKYREANKEKISKRSKAYYEAHKEKLSEYKKAGIKLGRKNQENLKITNYLTRV